MVHTSNAVIQSKGIRLAVSQTHWSILRRTATTLPGDPAAAAQANNRQGSFRKWSKKILTEYVVSKESLKPEGFQLQFPVGSRSLKVWHSISASVAEGYNQTYHHVRCMT
jgi:hypothetical protein